MKSNVEWKYWGSTDPLYGVSSVSGKSKTHATPWTDEEFYSRGGPDWADFVRHWEHYGVSRDACVEIGCGAGRMTRCLQQYFKRVHAMDVSPGMIEYARKNCDPAVVTFHLTEGTNLPIPDGSVSAAFSTVVFQHLNTTADGLQYFRELYRVLAKGGTFMINLPLYEWPRGPLEGMLPIGYRLSLALNSLRASLKRLVIRGGPTVMKTRVGRKLGEHMHGTCYEWRWLYDSLLAMGFADVEVRTFFVKSEDRYHPFVFARKS